MSVSVSPESLVLFKKLISHITGFQEKNEKFQNLERKIVSMAEKSDSMSFLSRDELNKVMESVGDKFLFHGFRTQRDQLLSFYFKFMDEMSTFYDPSYKISIIRFIVAMSNSPTKNYSRFYEETKEVNSQLQMDWGEYLKEGIDKWQPPLDESDPEWSDNTERSEDISEKDNTVIFVEKENKIDDNDRKGKKINKTEMKYFAHQKLSGQVQNMWFNAKKIREKPLSDVPESNIAFIWDIHMSKLNDTLTTYDKPNILTEYKVMREVIWQIYEPTTTVFFELNGGNLSVKKNVTISSIRQNCLETILDKMIFYINIIQNLRKFQDSIMKLDITESELPTETYKSYASSLKYVLDPLYEKIREIEKEVSVQETITTLLVLFERLKPILVTFELVENIHDSVVIDFKKHSPLHCSTSLINKLYKLLPMACNKTEQDIINCLFLGSLKKYLCLVQSWIYNNIFEDDKEEFLVQKSNISGKKAIKFSRRKLDSELMSNDILNIFFTEIYFIGRNISFLRLLGTLNIPDILPESRLNAESLYEEYVNNILDEVSKYYLNSDQSTENEVSSGDLNYSVDSGLESSFHINEELKLNSENFFTPNVFLTDTFTPYFSKEKKVTVVKENIYQRICKTTSDLCPIQIIAKKLLIQLFTEKFNGLGAVTKKILVSEYKLEKYFKFLKQLFLFDEDLISPFYKSYIKRVVQDDEMVPDIHLTFQLHDLLVDYYPDFYQDCMVRFQENEGNCNEPVFMCNRMKIYLRDNWPLSLIVDGKQLSMYQYVFQFILLLKWALFTLNNLYFADLKKIKNVYLESNRIGRKLGFFRFNLLNIFNSIQSYFLGEIYAKEVKKFREDFEKSTYYDTIYQSHEDFITSLHYDCKQLRCYEVNGGGFRLLLYLVSEIRYMWKCPQSVNIDELEKSINLEKKCHNALEPILTMYSVFGQSKLRKLACIFDKRNKESRYLLDDYCTVTECSNRKKGNGFRYKEEGEATFSYGSVDENSGKIGGKRMHFPGQISLDYEY